MKETLKQLWLHESKMLRTFLWPFCSQIPTANINLNI